MQFGLQERGFSLIELMIIVAITAIMSALAIPTYDAYTVRARVAESMLFVGQAKIVVTENVLGGSTTLDAGWVSPPSTENMDSISVDSNDGAITIDLAPKAGDGTLVFYPTSGGIALTPGLSMGDEVRWSCTGGTLASKYRPHDCR